MNNSPEWVPVPGYEGRYEITKCGRIRSLDRATVQTRRGKSRPFPVRAKELRPTQGHGGYPAVELAHENGRRRHHMHRLLAMAFISNPNGLPCVNHLDGNKCNNALANLEWCTPKENARHASRMGLLPKGKIGPGERSPAAKLTDNDVREMRRRVASGETQRAVAAAFNVTYGNVSLIVRRLTWAHV